MREEPLNCNFDPHQFLIDHGEELEQGIIKEENVSDIFDFILEMSIRDIREVKSYLTILYLHLLKYQYQFHRQSKSWIDSIRYSSSAVLEIIESSKALRNKIDDILINKAYELGRNKAIAETGMNSANFPKSIPNEFNLDKITDYNYIESYLRNYAYTEEAKKELNL